MPNNPFLTLTSDAVTANRLARLQDTLRSLEISTREEYQAEIYSLVNSVLNLQGKMQPLLPVRGGSPAAVGDLTGSLTRLNLDATDLAAELLAIENQAGDLYNLTATQQNALRQTIREGLFLSTPAHFVEGFLHDTQLAAGYSATLDYNAGAAMLPLVKETPVKPVLSLGLGSRGSTSSLLTSLAQPTLGMAFVWDGPVLELIFTCNTPQILNRLQIQLDTYDGLEITALTTSPDGTLTQDVLEDMGISFLLMDATSGKYTGDVILDFPPRYVTQGRIRFEDRAGTAQIALRSLSFSSRQYSPTGTLTTLPIELARADATFLAEQSVTAPYTTITHQLSPDGVNFQNIDPGPVSLPRPCWYRALLQRSDAAFQNSQSALAASGASTAPNDSYTLESQSSVPLGNGVLERKIVLSNVSGGLILNDTPMPNTLRVQGASVFLGSGDYTLKGKQITFTGPQGLVTLTYQTSALGSAALAALKNYFTPLLSQVEFQA